MNSENNYSPDDRVKEEYNGNEKKPSKGNDNEGFNIAKEILDLIVYFIVLVLIFLLLQYFVGQHIEVNGSSMENTLSNGDHLILEKVSYRFNDPERFDIVVFRPFDTKEQKNTFFIKRIIGLPGETVQIIDGQIYINGEVSEEDYGNDVIRNPGIASSKITLDDDEYFLLGDNRNNSSDSRFSEVGPVKREAIIGRAWMRIWPLNKIGILNH